MAYAAVVSLVQVLEQIAQQDQYTIFFSGHKQQLESLHEKFCSLLSFLENDPLDGGEVMYFRERVIREVAYEAQDMIESHISYQISHIASVPPDSPEVKNPPKVKHRSWGLLSAVKKLSSSKKPPEKQPDPVFNDSRKVHQDLQKVEKDIDYIVEGIMAIKKDLRVVSNDDSADAGFPFPRLAPVNKTSLVGFDEDIEEIKDKLCGESSSLRVISLVGMGGIGKTTLAQNIFDDSLITYHFHIRAWITVSQNNPLREILLSLLNSITVIKEKLSQESEDILAECVYKRLKGVRYLIVLDDVWSIQAWEDLKRIFPDDHLGSRIILTTRLIDVGTYASSPDHLHDMKFLNEYQSWNLLREKVFGEECCPPHLETNGKLIAKNCQGLPLAIVVVAGLLSKENRTKYHWESIARNVSSAVTANDGNFSKILSLSYNHLPRHLKACFLYMGGFPEDYEIPIFKLVNLWIAEGFLKSNELKSSEEVGEEYLQELVNRSLVLVTKKRSASGRFKCCSIHDLLRDLCIQKAKDENFLHVVNDFEEDIKNKRRLCFSKSVEKYYFDVAFKPSSSSHTIFCYSYDHRVICFNLLKVLDILEHIFDSFPVEILKLFHLRYLALNRGIIRRATLPPLFHKLENLQTLIIGSSLTSRASDPVFSVHLQIWKMRQLRHLIYDDITLSPVSLTEGIFPTLENLQTLSRVRNFRFTNEAIDMIPNLKKLKVIYTGEPSTQRFGYDLNNLFYLHSLETLNLKFEPSSNWWRDPYPIKFGIPSNLRKLTLNGCRLSWTEMTPVGSLTTLEVLKLRSLSFTGEEWEPVEGEFSQLKILVMEWLELKYWRAEKSHFPILERLTIRHCSVLEEIPSEIGDIPTLQVIEVDHCKLAADSAELILEEQQNMGNDVLQVRVIGTDYEDDVHVTNFNYEDEVHVTGFDYDSDSDDEVHVSDYEDKVHVRDFDDPESEDEAHVSDYEDEVRFRGFDDPDSEDEVLVTGFDYDSEDDAEVHVSDSEDDAEFHNSDPEDEVRIMGFYDDVW